MESHVRCAVAKLSLLLMASMAAAAAFAAPMPSPFDHGGQEVDPLRAPVVIPGYRELDPTASPIEHADVTGEYGLFGYNPRFAPNVVTFDQFNRPYIRVAAGTEAGYPLRFNAADAYVQTLNDAGQWVVHSLGDAVRSAHGSWWNGTIQGGTHVQDERVVFDADGDAYTIVTASGLGGRRLLHSRDGMQTWDSYRIDGHFRIETPDSFNDQGGPPVLVRWGSGISIITPTKGADGRLIMPAPVQITTVPTHIPGPTHSGLSNVSFTKDNLTHIVFIDAPDPRDAQGRRIPGPTDQFIVTYNHVDGTFTAPRLLGSPHSIGTGNTHNGPGITMDSDGVLHVVLGSHQDRFHHTQSLEPNSSTDGWSGLVPVAGRGNRMTYVSLVTTPDDTMHLVSRHVDREGDRGLGQHYELHYMRRQKDENGDWLPWQDMGTLVEPYKGGNPTSGGYAIYYQKLTLDRLGRLFLAYRYYDQDMIDAGGTAQNPALLMSDDGGDSWRLALTEDFLAGIIREPPLPGDANRDGRVDGEDFLIWQSNFGMQAGAGWDEGDFNGDGRVDGEDFLIWQSSFGTTSASAITPEPAAAGLLAIALPLLLMRRHGRC